MKRKINQTDGSGSPSPSCSVSFVPAGSGAWTTSDAMCENIAHDVLQKSGVRIYAETVEDVILQMEKRGYVKISSQNAEDRRPEAQ